MTTGTQTVSTIPSTSTISSPDYCSSVRHDGTIFTEVGPRSLRTLITRLRETLSTTAVDAIQDEIFRSGRDSDETRTALLRAAQSPRESGRVRAALLEVAASLDLAEAKVALVEALTDKEPRLREVAVEALADLIEDHTIREAITHIAERDLSPVIRAKALEALSE